MGGEIQSNVELLHTGSVVLAWEGKQSGFTSVSVSWYSYSHSDSSSSIEAFEVMLQAAVMQCLYQRMNTGWWGKSRNGSCSKYYWIVNPHYFNSRHRTCTFVRGGPEKRVHLFVCSAEHIFWSCCQRRLIGAEYGRLRSSQKACSTNMFRLQLVNPANSKKLGILY